jgi:hypothetical protein
VDHLDAIVQEGQTLANLKYLVTIFSEKVKITVKEE